MQLAQIAKIVSCVAPIDTAGVARQGARINMAKYDRVAFIISIGVTDAAVQTITVSRASGTLVAGTAIDFHYRAATTGAPLVSVLDGVFTLTPAATGLVVTHNVDDDKVYIIEVKASELLVRADQYVGVNFSNTATVCMVSCVAVCFWPRYAADADVMPDPTAA